MVVKLDERDLLFGSRFISLHPRRLNWLIAAIATSLFLLGTIIVYYSFVATSDLADAVVVVTATVIGAIVNILVLLLFLRAIEFNSTTNVQRRLNEFYLNDLQSSLQNIRLYERRGGTPVGSVTVRKPWDPLNTMFLIIFPLPDCPKCSRNWSRRWFPCAECETPYRASVLTRPEFIRLQFFVEKDKLDALGLSKHSTVNEFCRDLGFTMLDEFQLHDGAMIKTKHYTNSGPDIVFKLQIPISNAFLMRPDERFFAAQSVALVVESFLTKLVLRRPTQLNPSGKEELEDISV